MAATFFAIWLELSAIFLDDDRLFMDNLLLNLTHEQQQQAVEKIQQLMQQGVSSGEAIAIVAQELRHTYSKNSEN
ncbi:uncharacterized protein YoaH (UPF0181 family) [Bibersteinia trehalosi]|nr:uncharacterized protein YoaH (UPF0181 family) [Bibersteinia trehalosi]